MKKDRRFGEVRGYSFNRETQETVRFGHVVSGSEQSVSDALGWMNEVDDACEEVIRGKRPAHAGEKARRSPPREPAPSCRAANVDEALAWMDDCEEVIQVKRRETEALKPARAKPQGERAAAARREAALKKRASEARRRAAVERVTKARKKNSGRATVSLGWLDAIGSDEQRIEPPCAARRARQPQPRPEAPTRSQGSRRIEAERTKRAAASRTKRSASARAKRVELKRTERKPRRTERKPRRTERKPERTARRKRPTASEASLSASEVQMLGKSPDEVFDGVKRKSRKASRRVSLRRESGRLKRAELQRRVMESSDLTQALESGTGYAEPPAYFAPPPPRRESLFGDRPTPTKLERLQLERKLTESSCG